MNLRKLIKETEDEIVEPTVGGCDWITEIQEAESKRELVEMTDEALSLAVALRNEINYRERRK